MARDLATRVLARVVRYRIAILVAYALVLPFAVRIATQIPKETSIERLIVPNDREVAATREFHELFPEPRMVLLVFEADDPWSPEAVARVDEARAALADIPHVTAFSVADAIRRARPDADVAELRALANGTSFFRNQGLFGAHFTALVVTLDVTTSADRDAALAAIDTALERAGVGPVRRIGAPYVNAWLERESAESTGHAFVILGLLLVGITLFLYRSLRALLAIVIALGTAVALAMAAGGLLGFSFTIVSALVPLTVMVTTLATLTYLHSRFVDQPRGVPIAQHHLFALRTKLLPVTASTVAAASGFAALAISHIAPIREMGLWTATGLVIAWVVAYTLFPALQIVLRTPTVQRVAVRTAAFDRVTRELPGFTFRHRRAIVACAFALSAAGAAALFGVPGVIAAMPLQIDGLGNLDHDSALYRDARWFEQHGANLGNVHVWIHLPEPRATDADVLQAIDHFERALEHTPDITGVSGPMTPLRLRRYFAGHGDTLPADPDAFAAAVADVEQLLLTQPEFRAFMNPDLTDLQLSVLFRRDVGYATIARRIASVLPPLPGAEVHVVGDALLEARVGQSLVPTLAYSFLLTVGIILVVFVVVFRSALERLLAMIPSVFAILVSFLGLRLLGGALNVATIIIATTVLGTTENDQMHIFHHMHERSGAPLEVRLRHSFRVAGRAVWFATLINAIGFCGLATSSFPPLRQFGAMTASAFVLALIADFTVLPAALWIADARRHRETAPSGLQPPAPQPEG